MSWYYLDSSAAYKLVVTEDETAALSEFLSPAPQLISSRLTVVEVGRAVRRTAEAAEVQPRLRMLWGRVDIREMTDPILEAAEAIKPPQLRSLDAIQLATALSLGADLAGLVAYDRRLLEAAEAIGMRTFSPR